MSLAHLEPEARMIFNLSFRNDALAARALVLWTARTMPPLKKVRPKRRKGRTSPPKSANAGKPIAGRLIDGSKYPRQQALERDA